MIEIPILVLDFPPSLQLTSSLLFHSFSLFLFAACLAWFSWSSTNWEHDIVHQGKTNQLRKEVHACTRAQFQHLSISLSLITIV